MKTLRGVLGPVVTPFESSGGVDTAAFRANAQAHLAAGLSGLVVAGSTGEAPLLDDSERVALVENARKLVDANHWLIVGAGAESTRLTIRRAREAANAGADAVLVVSPHYYADLMNREALLTHFGRVADESPCPVILYNIPKYAHFALPADVVSELASHENVIGMKDSSGNMEMLPHYLSLQGDGFAVLTGHGGTWGRALSLGVRGGILGVSLFAAELTLGVLAAHERGDSAEVDRLQAMLTPVAKVIVGDLGVPGVKAAMDLAGLLGGAPRPPLLPLSDSGRAEVTRLLSEASVVREVTLPA